MTKVDPTKKKTKKVTPLKAPSPSTATAAKIHMKKTKKVTPVKKNVFPDLPFASNSPSPIKETSKSSKTKTTTKKKMVTTPTKTATSPKGKGSGGSGGGIGAPQRILNFVLSLEMKYGNPNVDRSMIVSMAGIKATTFPVTISNMKKQGLIEYDKTSIRLTTKGREEKATIVDIPDNESIQQELKVKHKLGSGKQGKLFDMLLDGKSHDRAHVAESVGYTNKATFAVALSNMKKMGIIEYDKSTIQLTDSCFPFGRP